MNQPYDCLVIGAGPAGAVAARELAERGGRRVLVLERRNHVGGNTYDRFDESGVLIHQYGPHIFHTNSRRVFEYLSRFTAWRPYEHKVVANIPEGDGRLDGWRTSSPPPTAGRRRSPFWSCAGIRIRRLPPWPTTSMTTCLSAIP